jgi:quercetin dioxygenase-like cupin family protein
MSFHLTSIPSKELHTNVIVRLVHGNELTLNYFELKNHDVKIPFHVHPVEHLVVILRGKVEFMFEDKIFVLSKDDYLFVPAKMKHTARVIDSPVKALELYSAKEDEYYQR